MLLKQKSRQFRSTSAFIQALRAGDVPVPILSINDRNEITGLIGEMVIEQYLTTGGYGVGFYSKFRKKGTSKSKGIDLINNNDGKLILIECKHPHEPIAQIVSNFESAISGVIDNSYMPCTHENNAIRLAAMRIEFEQSRQNALARGESTATIDDEIKILEDAMLKSDYSIVACILLDKRVATTLDLNVLESKIRYDLFPPFSNLITTIVVVLQDLETLTEKMFVKNGV
jgi:hypothetical protein